MLPLLLVEEGCCREQVIHWLSHIIFEQVHSCHDFSRTLVTGKYLLKIEINKQLSLTVLIFLSPSPRTLHACACMFLHVLCVHAAWIPVHQSSIRSLTVIFYLDPANVKIPELQDRVPAAKTRFQSTTKRQKETATASAACKTMAVNTIYSSHVTDVDNVGGSRSTERKCLKSVTHPVRKC